MKAYFLGILLFVSGVSSATPTGLSPVTCSIHGYVGRRQLQKRFTIQPGQSVANESFEGGGVQIFASWDSQGLAVVRPEGVPYALSLSIYSLEKDLTAQAVGSVRSTTSGSLISHSNSIAVSVDCAP